jgi:hypothetical protein
LRQMWMSWTLIGCLSGTARLLFISTQMVKT